MRGLRDTLCSPLLELLCINYWLANYYLLETSAHATWNQVEPSRAIIASNEHLRRSVVSRELRYAIDYILPWRCKNTESIPYPFGHPLTRIDPFSCEIDFLDFLLRLITRGLRK